MKCRFCNQENAPGVNFCTRCGKNLFTQTVSVPLDGRMTLPVTDEYGHTSNVPPTSAAGISAPANNAFDARTTAANGCTASTVSNRMSQPAPIDPYSQTSAVTFTQATSPHFTSAAPGYGPGHTSPAPNMTASAPHPGRPMTYNTHSAPANGGHNGSPAGLGGFYTGGMPSGKPPKKPTNWSAIAAGCALALIGIGVAAWLFLAGPFSAPEKERTAGSFTTEDNQIALVPPKTDSRTPENTSNAKETDKTANAAIQEEKPDVNNKEIPKRPRIDESTEKPKETSKDTEKPKDSQKPKDSEKPKEAAKTPEEPSKPADDHDDLVSTELPASIDPGCDNPRHEVRSCGALRNWKEIRAMSLDPAAGAGFDLATITSAQSYEEILKAVDTALATSGGAPEKCCIVLGGGKAADSSVISWMDADGAFSGREISLENDEAAGIHWCNGAANLDEYPEDMEAYLILRIGEDGDWGLQLISEEDAKALEGAAFYFADYNPDYDSSAC